MNMTTYLAYFVCSPVEGTSNYHLHATACYFVWILHTNQADAEKRARQVVEHEGWKIDTFKGIHVFTRESAAGHPDNLRSFEAVQRCGIVSECITSPAGDAPRFN